MNKSHTHDPALRGENAEDQGRSARAPDVAIVVPTFREVENLRPLIDRLERVRSKIPGSTTLLVVDDDSQDGTQELMLDLCRDPRRHWIQFHCRKEQRGLSSAVLTGLRLRRADVYVVMDADLSHPPECIPDMVTLAWYGNGDGQVDMVLGSRYVESASMGKGWGWLNRLNSLAATWLARPFAAVSDPMSGLFAIRGDALAEAADLSPVGYKIGLELMVKCPVQRIVEVPFHFHERVAGKSKTTMAQRLLYLKHLRRLALFRYPERWQLFHFSVVGSIGAIVNLVVLSTLDWLGAPVHASIPIAILVSMFGNFFLNRRFSFPAGPSTPVLGPLLKFLASCTLGMLINTFVALSLIRAAPGIPIQVGAAAGIVAGMGINYMMTRFFIFPGLQQAE